MTKNETHIKDAVNVAIILLDQANIDQGIILWDKKKLKNKNSSVIEFDYCLSTGTSGIIFFYAELYDLTKDRKYLEIIEKAVYGLVINLNKESHFHFGIMKGLSGVVFLFIKLFIVTHNNKYLLLAKKYCKILSDNIFSDSLNNSLFDGRAGVLIVFFNLYLITYDKNLLDLIYNIVRKIIWDARYDLDGLNWYHSQTQVSGLVGFGYGAVGISYALSLINNYIIKDENIETVFKGGFEYCKNQWNTKTKNWPDYNIRIKTRNDDIGLIKRCFNVRERRIILKGKDTISFSDGFIGILFGLSFINNRMNLDEPINILIKTSKLHLNKIEGNFNDILDFSALLSVKLLHKEKVENLYTNKRLAYYEGKIGLINGLSGIGYLELIASEKIINPYFSFYLDSANPENKIKVKSLLLDNFDIKNLILFPYLKHYPATMKLISKEHNKSTIKEFYLHLPKMDFVYFRKLVGQLLNTNLNNEILRTVFRYEVLRHQFYRKKRCCVELYIDNYLGYNANQSLQKMGNSEILNKTFVLSKNSKIISLNYNISQLLNGINPTENDIVEKCKTYILLQYTDTDSYVREEILSDLDEIILNFKKPLKAGYVLETLITQYDLENKRNHVQMRFKTVILKYVQTGTLISLD